MNSSIEELACLVDKDDPFDYKLGLVRDCQLSAANERLNHARETMRVVDRRASDAGIDVINGIQDLVPLLFSHTTYKSYPESFIAKGQWQKLGTWLDALSTVRGAADVDTTGVADIDDWLGRLRQAGITVYNTSGSSGTVSLFRQSEADRKMGARQFEMLIRWRTGAVPSQDRHVFVLAPSQGFHRLVDDFTHLAEVFGRPGGIHFLSDAPLRISDVTAMARMRRAMADGTASPSDILDFQNRAAGRESETQDAASELVDALVKSCHEPAMIIGPAGPMFTIAEQARLRGLTGGLLPDSVIHIGALKGDNYPSDCMEQIEGIFRVPRSRWSRNYGMSEILGLMPECSASRHHCPPWLIPLILDKTATALVEPIQGAITGRVAFFDPMIDGRWGALATGDRATLNLDTCPCGRPSPTFSDIARYSDVEGDDDKLSCAGTVEAYLKGFAVDDRS